MNKSVTLVLTLAIATVIGIGQVVAGGPKPKDGGNLLDAEITDSVVVDGIDHFTADAYGNGPNAGVVAEAAIALQGIGTSGKHSVTTFDLDTSVSWDWGTYNDDHRCALGSGPIKSVYDSVEI